MASRNQDVFSRMKLNKIYSIGDGGGDSYYYSSFEERVSKNVKENGTYSLTVVEIKDSGYTNGPPTKPIVDIYTDVDINSDKFTEICKWLVNEL